MKETPSTVKNALIYVCVRMQC